MHVRRRPLAQTVASHAAVKIDSRSHYFPLFSLKYQFEIIVYKISLNVAPLGSWLFRPMLLGSILEFQFLIFNSSHSYRIECVMIKPPMTENLQDM